MLHPASISGLHENNEPENQDVKRILSLTDLNIVLQIKEERTKALIGADSLRVDQYHTGRPHFLPFPVYSYISSW